MATVEYTVEYIWVIVMCDWVIYYYVYYEHVVW